MAASDPIEHVVVLMLENRSFDHMLGACQQIKTDLDGIDPAKPPRQNRYEGKTYKQLPGAKRIVVEDPRHETPHVLTQLKPDASGLPGGFVCDYANANLHKLQPAARGEVMKYHALGQLPATHALAENFAVCDKWFSSVPGPTWSNRLFAMSGTSLGRVDMPEGVLDLNLHWYNQTTLFDRLDERGIDWAVYYGDVPLSLLLVHQWRAENRARHKSLRDLPKDAAGPSETFPQFVFIEPAYLDPGGNSGHPPHDILATEALVADVYNTLRRHEDLWAKTLLVVLCDEHGGFYDHVMPPDAVPPDHLQSDGFAFNRLGVRVPALLVSPWMPNGVISDTFDHTSLLKYLMDKWSLNTLRNRAAQAKSFAGYMLDQPRKDCPPSIPSIPADMTPCVPPKQKSLSAHENGIVALSHALETMAGEDPAVIAARSQQMVSDPQSQIDVACDRAWNFLKQTGVAALRMVEH